MGYHAFPSASWNYSDDYSELSALKPVGDLAIKEKLESKHLSPLILCEICEETISNGDANERYAVLSLARANANTPAQHPKSYKSRAGIPGRMW